MDKNKDYYHKIKEQNYHYTIKFSTSDIKTLEFYKNILSKTPNLNKIKELYTELDENRVKGWIMLYAAKLIIIT